MGLNSRVFELLVRFGGTVENRSALIAGYPDFIVDKDTLQRTLGTSFFPADEFSDQIKLGHRQPSLDFAREPISVFNYMGYSKVDIIDNVRHRGIETEVDLNVSQPLGSYDLVLDHRTLEHCFNIGVAALNLANAVAVGGIIVSHLPLNLMNHGFYNINPTWFRHLYSRKNGFEIPYFELWNMCNGRIVLDPPRTEFVATEPGWLATCIAKRTRAIEPRFPIQGEVR